MGTQTFKLIETDSKFLEAAGHNIHLSEGNDWYFMPFWFKKIGEGLYVEYRFEHLPEDIKKEIQQNKVHL